ncbi:MAG: trypsin-like peptidase domain-containing protein, partial [Alphaproteobacteria bacterium]|nr:trypsin-like peptidase domain-containing protein [Alphaproteobacteria bacterium]
MATGGKWRYGLTATALAVALAAPYLLYPVFLMEALCFALFACAFNLLTGYVGLLSFGHAAFLGSAAYITAHAVKVWGFPPELGILAGVAVASLLGAVFGWLAIRRQGIYFAMITLAFAQMIYFVALQARFTGGEDGIQAVPRGHLFGVIDLNDTLTMYYFVLAMFLIGFAVVFRTIHSPFGQVTKAIRENEPRAVSLGYDADRYKLLAFVLSAALSGLAGSMKALVFQLASLTDVQWTTSGEVVLMTLVGGLGTIFGPVVGAFLLTAMQHYLAQLGSWVTVVQGVIFVFCVLLFRRGIVGVIAAFVADRRKTRGLSREGAAGVAKPLAKTSVVVAALLFFTGTSFADDPAHRLEAVVHVHAEVPPEARTAAFLGTTRDGSGTVIDAAGLIVTIGYLITEAMAAEVTTASGRVSRADIVGFDTDSGLGLLRATDPLAVTPLALGTANGLSEKTAVVVAARGGADAARPAVVVSRRPFAGYWEYLLEDAIFTAPPYRAWSGAALVAPDGKLAGIGSLIVGDAADGRPGNMFVP